MDGMMFDGGYEWLRFDWVIRVRALVLCFNGRKGLAIVGSRYFGVAFQSLFLLW